MNKTLEKSNKQNQHILVLNDSLPEPLERLLNDKGIDWRGDMLGKSEYLCRKIPVIDRNSRLYSQLLEAISRFEKLLEPSCDTETIQLLAKLRLHFVLSQLSEAEIGILINDYLEDVSIYPLDIIEQACIDYRRDKNSLFFPKVGQLLELIKERWYPRKYKLQKLKKLLDASQSAAQD